MTDINQKRETVKKHFRDPSKVDEMSDAQVTAIYLRLEREKKL